MKKATICLVDDERIIRLTIADELRDYGYKVHEFAEGTAALSMMREVAFDVVITDIQMPVMDGLELIRRAKSINPTLDFVVMTAYGSIKNAVEAMKLGAYNYLTKPFEIEELLLSLHRITERSELRNDLEILKKQVYENYDFSAFVGESPQVMEIFELVKLISQNDTCVLVSGETGTGKELLTNIIHFNSLRKGKPLVKVGCALLSKEIFESELFGHEKGAFTGAEKMRTGRFEAANGGTIYLDDIDDMPLDLQVKLLRVLEEGEIERVGSNDTIKVDVRVIASTKENLKKLVDEGRFRSDLYYRLNVFPINIPSLRHRTKDVYVLVKHFAHKFSNGRRLEVEQGVFTLLSSYSFPGNTRELKNIVERMVLLAQHESTLRVAHLPLEVRHPSYKLASDKFDGKALPEILSEVEFSAIVQALELCNQNQSRAAQRLGIPLSTLRTKMEKYTIH
jgi:DNA-binding NtrC family response regulator